MKPHKLSTAEKTALWFSLRRALLDTALRRQSHSAAALNQQVLSAHKPSLFYMTTRLQVRSFPLGCRIRLDGQLTPFTTPHTFTDLSEGSHTIELLYDDPETGTTRTLSKTLVLEHGKRAICKLYFKQPVTLAPVIPGFKPEV